MATLRASWAAAKFRLRGSLLVSGRHWPCLAPAGRGRAFSTNKEEPGKAIDFGDSRAAFQSKSTFELLRAWSVFQTCAIPFVVRNCDTLYNMGVRILGPTFVHGVLRRTMFGHFCAGETVAEIQPRMAQLQELGVGGILDYAAEAKDGELPEIENVDKDHEEETMGAPRSARLYDYKGEKMCDANAEIFKDAVRNVREATPDGFAAIKLSGLGDPRLLERMSTCLVEMARLFEKLADPDSSAQGGVQKPNNLINRDVKLDYDTFKKSWTRFFAVESEEELRAAFLEIDTLHDDLIMYHEWSTSLKLSEINTLVRTCRHQGPLYRAALDAEEVQLYHNMIARVKGILSLAQELKVRVMIDAEWCDIQPAIDHIVLFQQREFNVNVDHPLVFNTYQTYLKGMNTKVLRDIERSEREGWKFGAKVVRGAYMVSEREKAEKRGVESPICENYEETQENFHNAIDMILGRPDTEILVATHNRESVERTLQKMAELDVEPGRVGFGQLLGMADHLTFTLGQHGYRAYKYVPYGPIDEVVPYLIRRTQENSSILGSPGVQEERHMIGREVRRRVLRF
eukprot:TRINITY_DN170_c0_g1_i8.p1 TRINITY_DN170_c0_g1~~TRINITY_DN170_c0_g1_i8.p1  ORF type:complete len:570 (-),score=106.08 TRINITY_DN170_c0_g1_i8:216-1925(-)